MMLVKWILGALGILLVTYIVPGVTVSSFLTALLVALVLGLFGAIVRPVLILLTLPVTILSLGLFILFINAGLFLLASYLIPGFEVSGFWSAFWGAIVVGLIGWAVNVVFGDKKR